MEPVSISNEAVAAFLDRSRRPRMAAFVRGFDAQARRYASRLVYLEERLSDVEKRLEKYEPLQGHKLMPDFRAPADASD